LNDLHNALPGERLTHVVEFVEWVYVDTYAYWTGYGLALALGILAVASRMRWPAAIISLIAIGTVCGMLAVPPIAFWITNKAILKALHDGPKKRLVPPRTDREEKSG
jgi:hypothetical protein